MDGMRAPSPTGRPQSVEDVARDEIMMLDIHQQMEEERKSKPPAIGEEQIRKASEILKKYKEGKGNLENKIINDEQYWKLRHWDTHYDKGDDYKPTTSWLWSCIQSRYSDAMDSYPTCNFLARQEDDKMEAKRLSAIVPIILEQNRYEETYSDVVWYTLKHGGSVQGVFWDKSKHNGLGDIEIKKVDYLNLFWESGITDIQDSEHLFCVELVNKRKLESEYPQCEGHLNNEDISVAKYIYDDKVDLEDKAVVIDWYYHKYINGKKILHYVKYVNDVVLYATENDTEPPQRTDIDPQTGLPVIISIKDPNTGEPMKPMSERGLYDHGQYPFVNMALYPIEGSLCGYGLTDIGKDPQNQIDVLNKAITENAVANAAPRYIAKRNMGINPEEFLNVDNPIILADGDLQSGLVPIQNAQLSGIYLEVQQSLIDGLKFFTSNQDVANGQAPSGVTAASAIAALQETQGKNARSSNKGFYRAFREVCYQVMELMRQFYDLPRTFRIAPDILENSEEEYINYTNSTLRPQMQMVAGQYFGLRTPEFDIEITAEKQSPYKKMEQNELALNFYNMGFFDPQNATKALACLKMMDFDRKEDVIGQVRQNGTIYETMLQYEQIALQASQKVAELTGLPQDAQFVDQLAQGVMQTNQTLAPSGAGSAEPIDLGEGATEGKHMLKAREQARESTQE